MTIDSKPKILLLTEALEGHKILLKLNRDHLVASSGPDTLKHIVKIESDLIILNDLQHDVTHNLNS